MGSSAAPSRIQSLDVLRGAVMVVMALDHIREYFHADAFLFSPENLARSTPLLFFTRWITHFCAPVFMFTAGAGAFLWLQRSASKPQLTRFLWTRGLWLILLEVTFMRLALNFSLGEGFVLLSILWALGCSMVVLSLLVRLPLPALTVLSLATIATHNLLDGVKASQFGAAGWVWNLLHQPGVFPARSPIFLAAYPLVPWIAVMSAGFCFGQVILMDPARRRRWMLRIGLGSIAAFLVLRTLNGYGNPAPWSVQRSGLLTLCSYLNCTKYPPSLDFLLMTLGLAVLSLVWLDRVQWPRWHPLRIFGRVPLFYFLLHLYMVHGLAALLALFRYGTAAFLFHPFPSLGGPPNAYPADYGYPLGVVYLVWIVIVVSIYPACLWFSGLKARRKDWWLRYL